MDLATRIAQFENMANADPNNEMAHFSLGGAYVQAGRFADAGEAYLRCTAVNPDMSKAWQLAADAFAKAGQRDRAADAAKKGYEIAALRGDLMPKNAIASILKDLGLPLPEVKGTAAAPSASPLAGAGAFVCRQTGRPGTKLPAPPFRGPVGQWIFENIAAETWKSWIAQGTKVINELRLDLSREQDAETYDRHMREYLGIDDEVLASLRH